MHEYISDDGETGIVHKEDGDYSTSSGEGSTNNTVQVDGQKALNEAISNELGYNIELDRLISTTVIYNNGESYIRDIMDNIVIGGISILEDKIFTEATIIEGVAVGGSAVFAIMATALGIAKILNTHETIDVYDVGGKFTKKYSCYQLIDSEHENLHGNLIPLQYSYIEIYFANEEMNPDEILYIDAQNDGPPRLGYYE